MQAQFSTSLGKAVEMARRAGLEENKGAGRVSRLRGVVREKEKNRPSHPEVEGRLFERILPIALVIVRLVLQNNSRPGRGWGLETHHEFLVAARAIAGLAQKLDGCLDA